MAVVSPQGIQKGLEARARATSSAWPSGTAWKRPPSYPCPRGITAPVGRGWAGSAVQDGTPSRSSKASPARVTLHFSPERCVPALQRGLLHRAPGGGASSAGPRPAPRGVQTPSPQEAGRARRCQSFKHLWGARYAPLLPAARQGRGPSMEVPSRSLSTSHVQLPLAQRDTDRRTDTLDPAPSK